MKFADVTVGLTVIRRHAGDTLTESEAAVVLEFWVEVSLVLTRRRVVAGISSCVLVLFDPSAAVDF